VAQGCEQHRWLLESQVRKERPASRRLSLRAEKGEESEVTAKKIACQLFLTVIPWLLFWAVDAFWADVLKFLFSADANVPPFASLAPFEVLLIVGLVIAWRSNFPLWSYTWIGMLYFFGYRQVFQVVIELAPRVMPANPDFMIFVFYWIANPLALALLLGLITRRDWLLACLTAYPYTSVIQAWYTLDKTPLDIQLISLVLYGFSVILFMLLKSRVLKFITLLVGALVIGGGFFLYRYDLLVGGPSGFIFVNARHILMVTFPLIIHKIPLYRRIFKVHLRQGTAG